MGTPGWWEVSALHITRFPLAQLEKQGKSPVLIPGLLWQQWRRATAGREDCERSWMKERMEGDMSETRRGGGLRKEDRKAYHTIFFSQLEQTTWRRGAGLQWWPFIEGLNCYTGLQETRRTSLNWILCCALSKCEQMHHVQRGAGLVTTDSLDCCLHIVRNQA